MLKTILVILAGSIIILSMSIDTYFTGVFHSINFNLFNILTDTPVLLALLDLVTGNPANGFDFSNLEELYYVLEQANFLFELGYANINGVLVYAIKIGNVIYSVEPRIFHTLIYILFS